MRWFLLLLLVAIICVCSCGFKSQLAPSYEHLDFTVETPFAQDIKITTYAQGTVEGQFTVSGGERDIIFYIKNPYGSIVYGPVMVTEYGEFTMESLYAGEYTLVFDNSLSPHDKHITLHCTGYPD